MMKMLLNINHEGEGKTKKDCQKLKKKSNVTLEKDFQQKWANHFLTVIFYLFFSFFFPTFLLFIKRRMDIWILSTYLDTEWIRNG